MSRGLDLGGNSILPRASERGVQGVHCNESEVKKGMKMNEGEPLKLNGICLKRPIGNWAANQGVS